MKYIYTNVTGTIQSVLLASKEQDQVGVRTFTPGASLELTYPGLNLYVPNILSCLVLPNPEIMFVELEQVISESANDLVGVTFDDIPTPVKSTRKTKK